MPANDCKTISLFFWFNNKNQLQFGKACEHHCTKHLGDVTVKGFSSPSANPSSALEHHCTALPTQRNQKNARKDDKHREMGVRASPLPPQGYWGLPRSASGWCSRIWAASLKHALSLLCFFQNSPGTRKMGISTQHTVNYLPTQQLMYWPVVQESVLQKWKYNGYLALPPHPDLSVNIITTQNHPEVLLICVPTGW